MAKCVVKTTGQYTRILMLSQPAHTCWLFPSPVGRIRAGDDEGLCAYASNRRVGCAHHVCPELVEAVGRSTTYIWFQLPGSGLLNIA